MVSCVEMLRYLSVYLGPPTWSLVEGLSVIRFGSLAYLTSSNCVLGFVHWNFYLVL